MTTSSAKILDSGLKVPAAALSKGYPAFVEHSRILALSRSAAERVARLLLRLCDEFGEPTRSGIRLQTFLTHEEIAEMIGSSRETVTRSLNVLKRERVVLVKNGYLAFESSHTEVTLVNHFERVRNSLTRRAPLFRTFILPFGGRFI